MHVFVTSVFLSEMVRGRAGVWALVGAGRRMAISWIWTMSPHPALQLESWKLVLLQLSFTSLFSYFLMTLHCSVFCKCLHTNTHLYFYQDIKLNPNLCPDFNLNPPMSY